MIEKEKNKNLPIRKIINKNNRINENGSPREDVSKDDK